jgi:hypothetical protein
MVDLLGWGFLQRGRFTYPGLSGIVRSAQSAAGGFETLLIATQRLGFCTAARVQS